MNQEIKPKGKSNNSITLLLSILSLTYLSNKVHLNLLNIKLHFSWFLIPLTIKILWYIQYPVINHRGNKHEKKCIYLLYIYIYIFDYSTYDYTVEVRNRFKRLDLIDRVPDELWMEVRDILQETESRSSPRKRNAKKQNGCLRRPYK